jgi:hypothetical protein
LRIYSGMTGSLVWAAKRVRYSCQKMTTELNYKPAYDLQQGLEQTVKWGVMQGQLKSKAHTVTSGEAVKMALSQNRGIGCAYDYVIRGRQISKILTFYSQIENETVKTMLLVESKMKFCPPWEVALLCDRLGIQLHMLEEEKLSSISNRYDLSICVAENLVFKELEQIAAKLKKLSRWTTIIVHNGDNTKFHIGGWNGITARQVTFLRPRYWGYLDVFPLPANIQVFRGKNISTGMNKLLSLTGNLLVRFWPVTEDKIPPPVKKRMAHMIFGMY